jgi:eukaryotic-like serine/threonine-protein kinase
LVDRASGVREGQILAEKYRIERVLGAGAMGVVVAAYHLGLETKVAIKFLMPEMLGNEEALARFTREARAAAKITNEHVTRVLDVGTLETGAPFMVMEFLDGVDLHAWLARSGPLPVEQAVDFVLQACEAVAEAHDLGIIHRDLKPSNLFCVRRPNGALCIKVLDFGISKISKVSGSGPSMAMTRTSTTMGTPLYMSPEQMESARQVDARSDIWALGVTLFELLTGKTPFSGETLPEVCLKVTTHRAPPVRSFRSDVPEEIEAVIFKCLEKDRARRYESVGELCAAIAKFAPGRASLPSGKRVHRTLSAPEGLETLMAPEPFSDSPGVRRRSLSESVRGVGLTSAGSSRRAGAAVAILGVIAALGTAAVFLTRPQGTSSSASPGAESRAATIASTPVPITEPAAGPNLSPSARDLLLAPNPTEGTLHAWDAASAEEAPALRRGTKPPRSNATAPLAAPKGAAQPRTAPQTSATHAPEVPEAPKGQSAYDERL